MPSRISDDDRRRWIAEAVTDAPPMSPEFIAELDRIPSIIHTRTTRETFEVLSRELAKPRRFRIHRMEDGIRVKVPGVKKTFLEQGRTFHLWKCTEEQTNLI